MSKGSSDMSKTMSITISLPNFKSLCVLLIFQNAGVQQKNRFLIKMSLIRMGLYVPAFILGYLSEKLWFLYWGIDLEGVKDLWWYKILQITKNDHVVHKWFNFLIKDILRLKSSNLGRIVIPSNAGAGARYVSHIQWQVHCLGNEFYGGGANSLIHLAV